MDKKPIGVFDSGVGGLTVARAIRKVLPNEGVMYIGDTARVPYGTRSEATIKKYSLNVVQELLNNKVKALVIACNTISAVALDEIKNMVANWKPPHPDPLLRKERRIIPVVDVISPTVEFAYEKSLHKHIGIIATPATIKSGAYEKALKKIDKKVKVYTKATPLLVPIIEEGYYKHKIMDMMIEEYLSEFKGKIDTLVLGCTHYPLIKDQINDYFEDKVNVVDSAFATANKLQQVLMENNLLHVETKPMQVFFTSDDPSKSQKIARDFLGEELELRQVKL